MCKAIIGLVTFVLCAFVLTTVLMVGEYEIWKHDKEEAKKCKEEKHM